MFGYLSFHGSKKNVYHADDDDDDGRIIQSKLTFSLTDPSWSPQDQHFASLK